MTSKLRIAHNSYFPLIILFLLLFCWPTAFLVGQTEEEESEEKLERLEETRRQTILYGIDSQVEELIKELKEEQNDGFNDALVELFQNSNNENLRRRVLDFFLTLEDDRLRKSAQSMLERWEEYGANTVSELIRYLENFQNEEITELFFEILDEPNSSIASRALRAIGKAKTARLEYSQRLLDYKDDENFRPQLEGELIAALGALESPEAVEYVADIALDEDRESSLRWRACQALGDIGGEDAFKAVRELLNSDDTYLRAYAVGALAGFENQDVVDVLIDALRDGFWRVRVQAARALGELQAREAVEILEYKARQDPDVRNVRLAAVKALGAMDQPEAYEILRDLLGDEKANPLLRQEAARLLVENDLSESLDDITKLIEREWDKEKPIMLDYLCKQLSTTRDKSLSDLYRKMLSHPKLINLHLYGLRGIRLNGLSGLKEDVEKLTDKKYARSVRQLAQSVLEQL
ncbi:MAG TPA: HEAT repeat domain-containing protein [Sediminispirochaeta sp.]|nr:HEAT repeat domain-containing protein [Sediminispirochaeta sp.]